MKTEFANVGFCFLSIGRKGYVAQTNLLYDVHELRTYGRMMASYYSTTNNSSNLEQHSATRPPYTRGSLAMQHCSQRPSKKRLDTSEALKVEGKGVR